MSVENCGEAGGRQACASCKHQRKKCSGATCILYPYFPTEKARDFKIVHKYFGVGNMSKNIKKLAVEERERAVFSYVWAGRAWDINPSSGPLGICMDLEQENKQLKEEIRMLKTAINYGVNAGKYGNSYNDPCRALVGGAIEDVRKIQETKFGVNAENFGTDPSLHRSYYAIVGGMMEDATKTQGLKTATNHGLNAEDFGIDSSVNDSYSSHVKAAIEDAEAIPISYHQGNGLYNGGLLAIPCNEVGERDVEYGPYGIVRAQKRPDTNYGFWN